MTSDTPHAEINPDALVVARESRGRTQKEVADAAKVSQALISKAEHGLINLSPEDVGAVAEYLRYAPTFFFERDPMRGVGSACLYHRKRKTLPANTLKKLNARMHVRKVNVSRLLDDLDLEPDRSFHTLDPDEYGSPTRVAQALRAAWRVPDGPVRNLTALVESAGGIVMREEFGTRKLFGMSSWSKERPPLFFLNGSIPTAELRWTMAHELGHLTMHALPPSDDPESQADEFAGEFLAPASIFKHDARNLTFDRLPALKMKWRISMKAIITRAKKIGALSDAQALRLYKQHSARGFNAEEPYAIPDEEPSLVSSAIKIHREQRRYSSEELARAMHLDLAEYCRDFEGREPFSGNVASLSEHRSRTK